MKVLPHLANKGLSGQDLNEMFIPHPMATYCLRVQGDSMINAGIYDGDIIIVDRSIEVKDGDIVVAELDREFTVKQLKLHPTLHLLPANDDYKPIWVSEDQQFDLFGVVTSSIRKLR